MSSRFLDIFGMEHYHQLIKPEYVIATQTEATTEWTGEINAAGLAIGKLIIYDLHVYGNWDPATGNYITLNLTLSDGSTTGAKAVRTPDGDFARSSYHNLARLFMMYDGREWTIVRAPQRVFKQTYTFQQKTSINMLEFAPEGYFQEERDRDAAEVYINGLRLDDTEYSTLYSGRSLRIYFEEGGETAFRTFGVNDTIHVVVRK
jgi:hypothetical protein